MPVELTKELILKGRNYTKKITIPAYNAEVTIRSLTDLELSECISSAQKKSAGAQFLEKLFSDATKGKKGDISPSVAMEAIPLMAEIAIRGMIIYDRSVEPPRELSFEEKMEIVAQMQGMSVITVAAEILQLTVRPLEQLEDF